MELGLRGPDVRPTQKISSCSNFPSENQKEKIEERVRVCVCVRERERVREHNGPAGEATFDGEGVNVLRDLRAAPRMK